jgi:hypothetical protein
MCDMSVHTQSKAIVLQDRTHIIQIFAPVFINFLTFSKKTLHNGGVITNQFFIAAKYDKQYVLQFWQEISDRLVTYHNPTNSDTISSGLSSLVYYSFPGVMSTQGQGQSTKTDGQTTGTRVRGMTSQRKGESDLI